MALDFDLCPVPRGGEGDEDWVIGEEVPGVAAGLGDLLVVVEHPIGELVLVQVLPD